MKKTLAILLLSLPLLGGMSADKTANWEVHSNHPQIGIVICDNAPGEYPIVQELAGGVLEITCPKE